MPSHRTRESRIPHPLSQPPPPRSYGAPPGGAPSKLQQLQAGYQARLAQEKEQRLQALFDRQLEQQERTYNRIVRNSSAESGRSGFSSFSNNSSNSFASSIAAARRRAPAGGSNSGSVRDFFKQRRAGNGTTSPPPNQGRTQSYGPAPNVTYKRRSAGRDRSNPLAPINRATNLPDSEYHGNFNGGYYDREDGKRSTRDGVGSGDSDEGFARRNPQPPRARREAQVQQSRFRQPADQFGQGSVNRRERPSDFQQWQREQDDAKARRLENFRSHDNRENEENVEWSRPRQNPARRPARKPIHREPSTDDEGTPSSESEAHERAPPHQRRRDVAPAQRDDAQLELIRRKEQELQAALEKQRAELAAMQKQRAQEEEKLREAEKKRQRAEAERVRLKAATRRREATPESEDSPSPPPVRQKPPPRRRSPSPPPPAPAPAPQPKPKVKPAVPPPKRRPAPAPAAPPPPPEEEGEIRPPPSGADEYLKILQQAQDDAPQNVNLKPCKVCGRKFAVDRLDKHQTMCEKSKNKKPRKVFNTSKMRTEGTEAAQFVKHRPKTPEKPKKASNWRQKHEDFINNIRYAKQVTAVEQSGGSVAALPPPPRSENPDYVQCEHCGRRFNAAAAERHIPRCRDIKSKPKPLRR